uniref:Large ribosomal subunit protein eL29 n=1 Tax=Equus caballus TaxID=9796 RepID=A0A3Q2IJH9_HORSE
MMTTFFPRRLVPRTSGIQYQTRHFGAAGFGADMAKSKNHTTHSQSRKWHRKGIKKPRSQRCESLKGMDPKFLRNMRFAKKHKTVLKKMQANNAKCTCQGCQGPRKAQGSQAQNPKGGQPQAQFTYLHYSPQARETCSRPYCQGSQALPANGQGQGTNQGPGCGCNCGSGSGSCSQRCPGPHEGCQVETSVCQCEGGRTGVTPGWCPPALFVQINLRQDLSKEKKEKETLPFLGFL